jgi:hypothetical protein
VICNITENVAQKRKKAKNDVKMNNNSNSNVPTPRLNDSHSSAEASSSINPFLNVPNDENDQIDTSSFEDLSMNAAMGIDSSEYIILHEPSTDFFRAHPLSFKRKQTQQKPLSRFISHLYSSPSKRRQQRPPTIQIPPTSPDEYDVSEEIDEVQDFAEQGYGKDVLGEWVSEAGVGARKYDDLTAIGIHPRNKIVD